MIQVTSFKRNQIMNKKIEIPKIITITEARTPIKGEGAEYVVG